MGSGLLSAQPELLSIFFTEAAASVASMVATPLHMRILYHTRMVSMYHTCMLCTIRVWYSRKHYKNHEEIS